MSNPNFTYADGSTADIARFYTSNSIFVELAFCTDYRRLREIERLVKKRLSTFIHPEIKGIAIEGVGLGNLDMERIHAVVRAEVVAQTGVE